MLKEEKNNLVKQIEELERMIKSKDYEIDKLMVEKTSIKTQLEDLFNENSSFCFRRELKLSSCSLVGRRPKIKSHAASTKFGLQVNSSIGIPR